MKKPMISWILLLLHLLFLMDCSPPAVRTAPGPDLNFVARKLPEVELRTVKGEIRVAKLVRFKAQVLTVLLFPYWSAEPLEIPLGDIDSIKVREGKTSAGRTFAAAFGVSFIVVGLLAGAAARYDEDYQTALAGAASGGISIGGIAVLVGLLANATRRSEFEFLKMTYEEKVDSLRSIMGVGR